MIFFSAIAGIEVICIVKNIIVQTSVNLLLGGGFLWRAGTELNHIKQYRITHNKKWIACMIDAIFTGILGIAAIAISNNGSWIYMLTAGTYLVLYGFVSAIKVILETPEKIFRRR